MYSRFSHYPNPRSSHCHPLEDLVRQIVEDYLEERDQASKYQRLPLPPRWNVRPNLEEVVIGMVESYLEEKRQHKVTTPCDCGSRKISRGVEFETETYGWKPWWRPQCHNCACCVKPCQTWGGKVENEKAEVRKNVNTENDEQAKEDEGEEEEPKFPEGV